MVKELDLKLTLEMAREVITEGPPEEKSWGGGPGVSVSNLGTSDPKVTASQGLAVSCPISHSTNNPST